MNLIFNPPPHDFELLPGQVHIWSAKLDQPDSCLQTLYETLSKDERDRAERFVFEKDRRRFAACRGILRLLISRYQGVKADNISFIYGNNGKPALDASYNGEALYFNLSHSSDLALYAFTRDNEVGVDVEYMRDISDMGQIAERIFTAREIEAFLLLPEEEKKGSFFTSWTRKEALVKAIGKGLTLPLDRFEASLLSVKSPGVRDTNSNVRNMSGWSIIDLKPAVACIGALAVKCCMPETSCWHWELD